MSADDTTSRDESNENDAHEASDSDAVDPTVDSAGESAASSDAESSGGPGPPPSFGRQMAQLVIIPAVIAIAGIAVVMLFGVLAPSEETPEALVARIAQSGGVGKIGPFNDPRNSERYRAAATLSRMLKADEVDQEKFPDLHAKLIKVIKPFESGSGAAGSLPADAALDPQLHGMVVYILSQLGQPGGLEVVAQRLDGSYESIVQQFAILGVLQWPDREAATVHLPAVRDLLAERYPVELRTEAAWAVGALAKKGDTVSKDRLRAAMQTTESNSRTLRWNSAIALARLGDEQGGRFVADVLLNRDALADLPAAETGTDSTRKMPPAMQDHVILSTLHAVSEMTQPAVWASIERLENDPGNKEIAKQVDRLLRAKRESSDGSTDNP